MAPEDRALMELQDWVKARGEGLSIHFAGHHPTMFNDIPHPWCVEAGRYDREHYVGYGVSLRDAILVCHSNWKNDIVGARS